MGPVIDVSICGGARGPLGDRLQIFAPPTTGRDRARRNFIGGFWSGWRPPPLGALILRLKKLPQARLSREGLGAPILVQLRTASSREG